MEFLALYCFILHYWSLCNTEKNRNPFNKLLNLPNQNDPTFIWQCCWGWKFCIRTINEIVISLCSRCSVAKSCPTLWPHKVQHTMLPCPSLSPRVCPNSGPLSWWCYLTISSSAALFSFCLQSFPASGSFPVSQLFTLGGQIIGASVSAAVLPVNIQGWCPLEMTGLISLQSKGLSRVFASTTVWKHQFFRAQPSFMVQLSYPYITTWTTHIIL